MRKDSGLEITDHIDIVISPSEQTDAAIKAFDEYIRTQVLANSIRIAPNDGTLIDWEDADLYIKIQKS